MDGADHGFLSEDDGLLLHQRLLDNDPVAPSDLAQSYLEPLARYLVRKNPGTDENDCFTAAEDALLSLIENPRSYDPSRAKLDTYLRMAAVRDLMNLQRSEWRHRKQRADWGTVEISPVLGKYLHDQDADPAKVVELQEEIDERLQVQEATMPLDKARLSSQDQTILELIQIGERRTSFYAAALGITHLTPLEQQREVKRVKDRLKVRVKRTGGRHG